MIWPYIQMALGVFLIVLGVVSEFWKVHQEHKKFEAELNSYLNESLK